MSCQGNPFAKRLVMAITVVCRGGDDGEGLGDGIASGWELEWRGAEQLLCRMCHIALLWASNRDKAYWTGGTGLLLHFIIQGKLWPFDLKKKKSVSKIQTFGDFPGSPVVKTPHFHYRRHRFNLWSGN